MAQNFAACICVFQDNICTLLTRDEIDAIKSEFEKLDVNKGNT